jgi:lysophospholipase L1-like esterase
MKRLVVPAAVVLGLAGLVLWLEQDVYVQTSREVDFFESDIQAFEAAEREHPTAPGAIVFVGGSTILRWSTLERDLAPLRVVSRGFVGSQYAHLVRYADRIVIPLRPSAVVAYAGDNDLDAHTKKTAEQVVADAKAFARIVLDDLPEAHVYFLTIKPSKLRWARWPEMSRANDLLRELAKSERRIHVIDVSTPLLDASGRPRDDVYRFDGLHLNEVGYAEWARVLKEALAPHAEPQP